MQWHSFPPTNPSGWNGFALLIDDVERFAGDALNFSLAALDATVPHFFRLAVSCKPFCIYKAVELRDIDQFQLDGTSGDFTQAATLWPNGTWVDPQPGPS